MRHYCQSFLWQRQPRPASGHPGRVSRGFPLLQPQLTYTQPRCTSCVASRYPSVRRVLCNAIHDILRYRAPKVSLYPSMHTISSLHLSTSYLHWAKRPNDVSTNFSPSAAGPVFGRRGRMQYATTPSGRPLPQRTPVREQIARIFRISLRRAAARSSAPVLEAGPRHGGPRAECASSTRAELCACACARHAAPARRPVSLHASFSCLASAGGGLRPRSNRTKTTQPGFAAPHSTRACP
ncbi:hypothetical protein C8Q77DRAFT_679785 [Trametes polyzona]|nr:hypothetical protein C8Q77DRAFT_679785 [Trametes polyzona]